ncbi:hypothetical protein [Patulibacter minatonensis]|uniref:hypothetical protein n=1 Tax=Patulibacter minatonensis TaxID=298163 RepID=UPI0004B72139|nr:hypothetical protein [Patulibacter minatonensis]
MSTKRRLSVSVDAEVADAGQRAVDAGSAPTLSAWVNDALHARAARDRRLLALDEFLDDYEREFGAFDDAELAAIERRAQAGAAVVRGRAPGSSSGTAA